MVYISERIVNISGLETLIQDAKINFEILMDEVKKDVPSISTINGTAKVLKECLEKADTFEFLLEKRKCSIKDSSESQIS